MLELPTTGYVRIWQIIGDKKKGIPPLLPVSRSTLYGWIKSSKFPAPVKLSERISAWPVEKIRAMLEAADNSTTPL